MDFVFWIILIVLIVGVVWWLLNRSNSSSAGDSTPVRRDGGLAGGSAAASAEAAGTAGIPGAAGFGAAEPAPPTTADEAPERSNTAEPEAAGVSKDTDIAPESRAGQEEGSRVAGSPGSASPGIAAPSADAAADSAGEPDAVVVAADEPLSAEEAPAPAEPPAAAPSAAEPPAAAPLSREEAPAPAPVQEPGGSAESLSRQADEDEWETQWSEAGALPQATASHRPADEGSTATPATPRPEEPPAQNTEYIHHAEYTAPHSPTMPGAETAAAEAAETEADADAEFADAARDGTPPGSAPVAEPAQGWEPAISTDFEAAPEPAGHLAADQPYGAGSASAGRDGGGPTDFAVKGDAATMVYYEEGHADYEQAKADVWFESAAHAEAAGFRAPRRTRS